MPGYWNGLYLKASRERVAAAITELLEAKGYTATFNRDCRELSDLDALQAIPDLLKRLPDILDFSELGDDFDLLETEVVHKFEMLNTLSVGNGWVRVEGFDTEYACPQRTFFASELVHLLGCDAFDCGFMDTVAWWYAYYEAGEIVDRFDMRPEENFMTRYSDSPFDPDDQFSKTPDPNHPITIYMRANGLKYVPVSIPPEIREQFQGQPERLMPIMKKGITPQQAGKLVAPTRWLSWPESAIAQVAALIDLPYIGEYPVRDHLSASQIMQQRIEQGLTIQVFECPARTPSSRLKYPGGPHLEFYFYFAELDDATAFQKVTEAAVRLGAGFVGTGYIHIGEGIANQPFSASFDHPSQRIDVNSLDDVARYTTDPDARLVKIRMTNTTGIFRDAYDILTYQRISPEAARTDHHPIAIWTDSGAIGMPGLTASEEAPPDARQESQQVYRHFLKLLDILHPSYAAITVEWGMECPTDLQHEPRSLAFYDFYVSRSYLSAEKFTRLQSLHPGIHTELVAGGIYVSVPTDALLPQITQIIANPD